MERIELWAVTLAWIDSNSSWIVAFASAVLGSVAGSWWTQRAIERHERVSSGSAELRAINRAIMVCFAVVNACMGAKKQHLNKLVEDYRKCQGDVKAALASGTGVIHLSADMTSIPHPRSPALRLEDLMFREIRIGGRALAAATALVDAQQHLNNSLDLRDALIQEFRAAALDGQALAEVYLAIPQSNGSVDARHQDCVNALGLYINDCIFFAMVAAHDLRRHGERLISQHHGKIRTVMKHLHNVDWTSEDHRHLQPASSDYESWTKGFVEMPKWWQIWKRPAPMPLPF